MITAMEQNEALRGAPLCMNLQNALRRARKLGPRATVSVSINYPGIANPQGGRADGTCQGLGEQDGE